jgi:hypothetical protein
MALRVKILAGSSADGAMLASQLLRANLFEAGDGLMLVGHEPDSIEDGFSRSRIIGSTSRGLASSQICSHSQSQLTRDDLCAQLAPLERYGLAELSTALVDGLRALVIWLKNALRARRARANRQQPLRRL